MMAGRRVEAIKEEVLLELERMQKHGWLVVVEGKRDVLALQKLGLSHIVELVGPLFAVVERIAATEREVVLLVDLDPAGRKLYHVLARDLQKHGVRVHDEIRKLLFETPVRHIEGLATWVLGE